MLNLAISYGKLLDKTLKDNSGYSLTSEQYSNILGQISIKGYRSGCAYLVDSTGTILYHPETDMIGTPVDNTVVRGLVADISNNFYRVSDTTEYLFKGVEKLAAYHISDVDRSILVITLDVDDLNDTVGTSRNSLLLFALIFCVALMIIAFILIRLIVSPFKKLTDMSERLASLNLHEDKASARLQSRKDECGCTAKYLNIVREELSNILFELKQVSLAVHSGTSKIQDLSTQITEESTVNSGTTSELVSNLQITSASTEQIDSNINTIRQTASTIEDRAVTGSELAENVIKRAEELKDESNRSIKETRQIYSELRERTLAALEDSKAVNKIQELTASIRSVSTQTSMLSLNAAIEAARAGDQGRGFAVVANEIGGLASQSTETVNNINSIIDEVSSSVQELADSLNHMISFIDNNVIPGFESLSDVGTKYESDARSFGNSMNIINEHAIELNRLVQEIATSIEGINENIGDATKKITDISDKTNSIFKATTLSDELLIENIGDSERLNNIVEKFSQ